MKCQLETTAPFPSTNVPPRYLKATSAQKQLAMREIKAREIGRLVKVSGMVTRISDVRPLVTVATYVCDDCGNEIYQVVQAKQFLPISECPSETCVKNGVKGHLNLQTRGSKMVRFQEIRLQELPDQVPEGNIPRSITVHARGEMTRRCTAGNQVELSGIFLPIPYTGMHALRAGLISDSYVAAQSITLMNTSYESMEMSDEQRAAIDEIHSDPDRLQILYRSLAPEIYGLDDVKEALLLLLISGVTKTRRDGTFRPLLQAPPPADDGRRGTQACAFVAT